MTSIAGPSSVSRRLTRPSLGLGVLALGVAAIAVPTLVENLHQSWASEQGQAGPIVLALGLWLVVRRWPEMRAAGRPGSIPLGAAAGLVLGAAYVLGRVADQFLVESYAVYGLALVALYLLVGWPGLRKGWFPLLYLVFALPAPYTLTWTLTSHLRLWITQAAVALFQTLGFSIVRDGLNIFVDQYELAVKEACSGMNSLISLSAIGLIYLHIRRAPPPWYIALFAVPIVGFAILGNFARVAILILLTRGFGDAVAQGFLHQTAGLATFAVALLGVMGLDAIAAPFLLSSRRSARP